MAKEKELATATTETSTPPMLSSDTLRQEGIEVRMNQNDLLEIIAETKYQETLQQVEMFSQNSIRETLKKIYFEEQTKIQQLKESFVEAVIADNLEEEIKTKEELLDNVNLKFTDTSSEKNDIYYFLKSNSTSGDPSFTFYSRYFPEDFSFNQEDKIEISLSVSVTVSDKDKEEEDFRKEVTKKYYQRFSISIVNPRKKRKEVEKLRKEIKDFGTYLGTESYGQIVKFSLTRFVREARIKMNKGLISTQSSAIKKMLKESFNVKF